MISLLDIGIRFAAAAVLAQLVVQIFRQRQGRTLAGIPIAFALGLIAYLACSAPNWADFPSWIRISLLAGCLANPFLFWLFSRSIFEDSFGLRWHHAALLIAVEGIGYWYVLGLHESDASVGTRSLLSMATGGILQVTNIAFVVAAMITAYRGRIPDLIERRRKFRTLFVTATGGYMVLVTLVEVFLRGGTPHPLASLLNATAIFAIVFVVALALLTLKLTLLLEPARSGGEPEKYDVAAQELLLRLNAAIAKQVFTQDGLTIDKLAQQLGSQEYRLRQLINSKLGFRNFNDFLNHYRIQRAQELLADPAMARVPVLTVAMNLGYGSIGPFNRAFKLATGCTPTEFRSRNADLAVDKTQSHTI